MNSKCTQKRLARLGYHPALDPKQRRIALLYAIRMSSPKQVFDCLRLMRLQSLQSSFLRAISEDIDWIQVSFVFARTSFV